LDVTFLHLNGPTQFNDFLLIHPQNIDMLLFILINYLLLQQQRRCQSFILLQYPKIVLLELFVLIGKSSHYLLVEELVVFAD